MGKQVNVYGVAIVSVGFNSGTGSTSSSVLGTTRDGVQLTSDGYFIEVKNDEYGGDAGPPVEIQFLGETCKIRCELTKFDPAVAARVENHCQSPGGSGVPAAAGTLLFASSDAASTINVGYGGAVSITIATANGARTYPLCVIHDAVEVNRGTKFSTFNITFTAHKSTNGVLWTGT